MIVSASQSFSESGKTIPELRRQTHRDHPPAGFGDNEDALTNEYVFASEKGFLGPSSNPTDQSGFANKEDTVFGVSYEPVTKACFVKLFLLNASGTLVFVNNVNTRATKLLPAPWAEQAREFFRIESIADRHVYLQTVDFSTEARPTHNFRVLVAPDGTLTLR